MEYDLVLSGGTVVDGTGGPPRVADVAVRGNAIARVVDRSDMTNDGDGLSAGGAREIVDCRGLVVAPGFIDIHTHSDLTVVANPGSDSAVLQGVTTHVVGNCGFSPHPVDARRRGMLADHVAGVGGESHEISWTDIDGYAQILAANPPAINVVPLIGHGALRIAAMADPYGPVSSGDTATMRSILRENLQQGAAGLSTGLTYPPSALADPSEVEALAAVCADSGRMYATHARATADNELGAVDEAIAVSRRTGVRLEYSHVALNNPAHWGRAADVLGRFDAAAADGLPVGFDVYPYDASSSSAMQYLPLWVQCGGDAAVARNGSDASWRAEALADIRRGFFGGIAWQWDRIVLSAAPGMTEQLGKSFAEIAEFRGVEPAEVLLDLCVRHGSAAQVVLRYRTEGDMRAFLESPHSVLGSDGLARPRSLGDDHPHPRSFGAFPRVLGRYVRDGHVLDLPTAIRKMTAEPARRLGLLDRGLVAAGLVADLVVFDPVTVADRATFAEPARTPVGIVRTMVRGQTVAVDGRVTTSRPGRIVRCGVPPAT